MVRSLGSFSRTRLRVRRGKLYPDAMRIYFVILPRFSLIIIIQLGDIGIRVARLVLVRAGTVKKHADAQFPIAFLFFFFPHGGRGKGGIGSFASVDRERRNRQQRSGGRTRSPAPASAKRDFGPAHGHAGRIKAYPGRAAPERRFRAGLEHGLFPGVQVGFRADAAQPAPVNRGVACGVHGQVVIGVKLGFALAVQGFVGFAFGEDVHMAIHGAVSVAQNVFLPVVFDVDVHILFGVKVDFLFARPVFDAEFVEAARPLAAGSGHAPEHGPGLVFRQFIRRHGSRVVETPGDDRAIRIAFQKGDNDLLPDAGDRHASVFQTRPALGRAYPAACVPVPLSLAIPEELNLHPAVFVRIYFLAGGTGDKGGLIAHDPVFGVGRLGDEAGRLRDGRRPRRIGHAPIRGFAAEGLRLFPPAEDADHPPSGVDFLAIMPVQREGETGQKAGNVGFQLNGGLHGDLAQKLEPGIAVSLVPHIMEVGIAVDVMPHARSCWSLFGIRLGLGTFKYGRRCDEIPVAECCPVADALRTERQPGHDGGIGGLSGAGEIAEIGLAADAGAAGHVGEAQTVAVFGMLEIVVDALFLAQSGDEMEIGFSVLDAVFAGRVLVKAFEGEGFGGEVLFPENARDDFRDTFVLENAMVPCLFKEPQARHNDAFVVCEVIAATEPLHFPHQTMHKPALTRAIRNGQQGRRADKRGKFFS